MIHNGYYSRRSTSASGASGGKTKNKKNTRVLVEVTQTEGDYGRHTIGIILFNLRVLPHQTRAILCKAGMGQPKD